LGSSIIIIWLCTLKKAADLGSLFIYCNKYFELESTNTKRMDLGNDSLPRKRNGQFTTSPGKYPFSDQTSYTNDGLSGDIYVAAHSVVCGNFE